MLTSDRDQADYPMMAKSLRLSLGSATVRHQSQSPVIMIGVKSLCYPDEPDIGRVAGQNESWLGEGSR
jgi:hypothetical protein